jgi:threonine dehydrogenase-like Zn-dependent dehydrogenase
LRAGNDADGQERRPFGLGAALPQSGGYVKISQVIGPRTSEVIEVPDPRPADGQVLVQVVASGVCTSDLAPWRKGPGPKTARGDGQNSDDQDGDGRNGDGRNGDGQHPEPIRLGHEIVGRVVAAGRNARGWAEGDLVTGLGDRGFASLAVLDATAVLPVPGHIEPAHAIGEPVADLAEALGRTHLSAGQRVAVVGLGFMGLGLVQLAKDRAPGLLIGVDPLPGARQRGLELGCDLVFAPAEVPPEFGGANGGTPGQVPPARDQRADVVLEATGVTPGLRTASALVRPFVTLCVVGYHHAGDAMMDMDLWYKAVTIVNGFCPDRTRLMRAMRDALDLIAAHRFSYAPLVTHRFGLDEVDRAYELMDARADGFVKAVLEP